MNEQAKQIGALLEELYPRKYADTELRAIAEALARHPIEAVRGAIQAHFTSGRGRYRPSVGEITQHLPKVVHHRPQHTPEKPAEHPAGAWATHVCQHYGLPFTWPVSALLLRVYRKRFDVERREWLAVENGEARLATRLDALQRQLRMELTLRAQLSVGEAEDIASFVDASDSIAQQAFDWLCNTHTNPGDRQARLPMSA